MISRSLGPTSTSPALLNHGARNKFLCNGSPCSDVVHVVPSCCASPGGVANGSGGPALHWLAPVGDRGSMTPFLGIPPPCNISSATGASTATATNIAPHRTILCRLPCQLRSALAAEQVASRAYRCSQHHPLDPPPTPCGVNKPARTGMRRHSTGVPRVWSNGGLTAFGVWRRGRVEKCTCGSTGPLSPLAAPFLSDELCVRYTLSMSADDLPAQRLPRRPGASAY